MGAASNVDNIIVNSSTSTINTNEDISPSTALIPPFIDHISDVNVSKGGVLTIYGRGFSGSSTVYVDDSKIENLQIDLENNQISFVVPSQNGVHLLFVKNEIGESRFTTPIYFVVSDTILVKSKATKADSSNINDVENVLKLIGV